MNTVGLLQADVALLPFFERFRLALQLFQDYDLAGVQGGAVTQWMVSASALAADQRKQLAT